MRKHNNISEDVILFIGTSKVITLNNNHQIAFALRTLLVNQKIIYTYLNPLSSVNQSKLNAFSRSRNTPISLQKLTNHQYQYKISPALRPKLLLGQSDPGVLQYLKELKILNIDKEDNNIVAIVNEQDKSMNGFVFQHRKQAQQFYKSINISIMTQIYMSQLSDVFFNYKICNLLCNFMNGILVFDPQSFDSSQEESEMKLVMKIISNSRTQQLISLQDGLFHEILKFKIVDETSKDYAVQFLNLLPERIQKMVMSECQLNSNMFGQILSTQKLSEKMPNLLQLHLSKNNFNDDVFTIITRILSFSKGLAHLNLSQNLITFQKESILSSFLEAINNKMHLNLSKNKITNLKLIRKYLINAQGHIPISTLDISYNSIDPQHLSALTKVYIPKYQNKNGKYQMKLILTELEFQEPHAIQFFKLENYFKRTNFTSIPISLTKHPIKKHGLEIGFSKEEKSKAQKIDELFKIYCTELYKGNFYRLNQIKKELLSLNIEEEDFLMQTKPFQARRKQQEQNIINKFKAGLNFQLPAQSIIPQINNALKYARRKGLTGSAMDTLAYIKYKLQLYVEQYCKNKSISHIYQEVLFMKKGRFASIYDRSKIEDSIVRVDYSALINKKTSQLMKQLISDDFSNSTGLFMAYHYLLLPERPIKYHPYIIQSCLIDPRLSSAKIIHFEKENLIEFPERYRINKSFFKCKEAKINIATIYGIQTYKFSKSFIQSNISSAKYMSMLSQHKIQPEHQQIVKAFIQICKNFLIFLYYTPNELSQQTVIYINYITTYLFDLQTQSENDLKNVLVEEFIIHSITFYEKQAEPLKKGLLLMIFQFFARRISIQAQIIYRLLSYLIKTQQIQESQIEIHVTDRKEPWQAKVDWPIKDIPLLKSLILNKCKLQIKITDITNNLLSITLVIDEMATVLDLWHLIKTNIGKIAELMNINENNIDLYWICGLKSNSQKHGYKLLASYEHIGKLIFQDKYQRNFYLRRIISKPQYHSYHFLSKINYGELLQTYEQSKQNFRQSSFYMLQKGRQDKINELVIQMIWIDILLTEQVMLVVERRQNDEESLTKISLQVQKMVNQSISKLYSHYLPLGATFDDEDRMQIILQIKKRELENKKISNLSEMIKQNILNYLSRLGSLAYTITCTNHQDTFQLHLNNYNFAFVDTSNSVPKIIKSKFRNILWFQLALEADEPVLKFQVVEQVKHNDITIYSFSIRGDHLWLAQCFLLINQICTVRISYPTEFLLLCEDSDSGFCHHILKSKIETNYIVPPLDLTKYFKYKISRRLPIVKLNPPPTEPKRIKQKTNPQVSQSKNNNKSNPVIESSQDNTIKLQIPSENVFVKTPGKTIDLNMQQIAEIPERSSSSHINQSFDEILKNAQRQQNEDDLVVTARRSSTNSKKEPRRRSRNR